MKGRYMFCDYFIENLLVIKNDFEIFKEVHCYLSIAVGPALYDRFCAF